MMKPLTPLLAAVLLCGFSASPVTAQPSAPPSTSGNIAFCQDFIQQVEGVTLGRCLGFLQTSDLGSPGFIAQLCTAFEASDPEDFYLLYDSFADCVVTNHQQ